MVISQGDVCWAELPEPTGSGPGFRRPVVVVQSDALNRSRLATTVCVPLTSNLRWADAPGNVLLTGGMTGLSKDSVANVSQVVALDRTLLEERVGRIPPAQIGLLLTWSETGDTEAVGGYETHPMHGIDPAFTNTNAFSGAHHWMLTLTFRRGIGE